MYIQTYYIETGTKSLSWCMIHIRFSHTHMCICTHETHTHSEKGLVNCLLICHNSIWTNVFTYALSKFDMNKCAVKNITPQNMMRLVMNRKSSITLCWPINSLLCTVTNMNSSFKVLQSQIYRHCITGRELGAQTVFQQSCVCTPALSSSEQAGWRWAASAVDQQHQRRPHASITNWWHRPYWGESQALRCQLRANSAYSPRPAESLVNSMNPMSLALALLA